MAYKITDSVWFARLLIGGSYLSLVLFPTYFQPWLSRVYSWLYDTTFYQLSSFETIETVFFYALIELPFTRQFARRPELRLAKTQDGKHRPPKMRRPQHRILEIITYIAPLLIMDLTMIKKFAGVPISSIRASGGYPPYPVVPMNGTDISPHFLLPTLHNFSTSSLFQTRRALPPQPPTTRRLCLELTASFIIYDFVFFLLHLALHRMPLLKSVHLSHHTHAEIHPQITNRLSIVERLCLVLLANFSLNIIGSHVLTRTLFVPIFVWMLVEIHCGMDLPWGYEKILPRGVGLGAKAHAFHHRYGERGQGAYAPFFAWNDAILSCIERRAGYRRVKIA
jgi:cholesterol 25-hydroxylase